MHAGKHFTVESQNLSFLPWLEYSLSGKCTLSQEHEDILFCVPDGFTFYIQVKTIDLQLSWFIWDQISRCCPGWHWAHGPLAQPCDCWEHELFPLSLCEPPTSSPLHFWGTSPFLDDLIPASADCSPVDYFLCSLTLQPSRSSSGKILYRVDLVAVVVQLIPFSELMQDCPPLRSLPIRVSLLKLDLLFCQTNRQSHQRQELVRLREPKLRIKVDVGPATCQSTCSGTQSWEDHCNQSLSIKAWRSPCNEVSK